MRKNGFLILIFCIAAIAVKAQLSSDSIKKALRGGLAGMILQSPDNVMKFYQGYQYSSAWINHREYLQQLLMLLKKVPELGLQEKDYPYDSIRSLYDNPARLLSGNDSLRAEIHITDVALHFFRDVAYGNSPPSLGYNGLEYTPGCFDIPALLAEALYNNQLTGLLNKLEPEFAGYAALKHLLFRFNQRINDSPFLEVRVRPGVADNKKFILLKRLYQLGMNENPGLEYSDEEMEEQVKAVQHLFGLPDDGVLNFKTLEAMNVSLIARVEELKSAINTFRWLQCAGRSPHILVINIPSASLMLYASGNRVLNSKVIVGKRSTRTPTLASRITEVVLYPFWVVPNKIATRELLPLIRRDPGYLDANNMQVMDAGGKVVNPSTINWQTLSASYFPYKLRQSTGCDNSLGIVKFNFYSPYGVYLHDTPGKELFNRNRRFFSHGCIRVEKAIDLAHFLLKENSRAIDTLVEKGCLQRKSPSVLPASEKIPVFVLYNTAWINSLDDVRFNEDIYNRNSKSPK